LLAQRRPREQKLAVSGKLRGDRDTVRVDDFIASVGDSDLRGSLRLQKGDIPTISLDLHADSLHLAPLLEEAEQSYDATPEFDDGRLIPDIRVPFDAMARLNASVTVDIGELHRQTLHLTAVALKAELQDGAFYLREVGFKAPDGWFQARAALEPADGAGRAMLAARARDLRMGLFERGSGPATRANVDVNIQATGADLRALAGSSTGVLYLDMRNFTIPSNSFLKRLYGDLLNEIVDAINPFAKSDKETSVECVVLPIEINDGALGVIPEALMRTNKIRIVSDASINLKSEKIEMTFRTTPRKGLTISAGEILNPFVMVVGTLAAPRLAVDAKGTLLSGGAAVATGGLSILARATWDRLVRSKNPCETAAEEGRQALQDRFADLPSP
jgi:uncharacterized protein involved in outer membrane biogenesis